MGFDVSGIQGTPPGIQLKVSHECATEAEAIDLANRDTGSDLVVHYQEDGKEKFAVVSLQDKQGRTAFDPNTFHCDTALQNLIFSPDAHVKGVVYTHDARNGQRDLHVLTVAGMSVDDTISEALTLARAAIATPNGHHVAGFEAHDSTISAARTVELNQIEVLKQVEHALAPLNVQIAALQTDLHEAQQNGAPASQIQTLSNRLAGLAGQREELVTLRGMLRAELLTHMQTGLAIPGMSENNGKPVMVGSLGFDFPTVLRGLNSRKSNLQSQETDLQQQLKETADPAGRAILQARLESLHDQISLLDTSMTSAQQLDTQLRIDRTRATARVAILNEVTNALAGADQQLSALVTEIDHLSIPAGDPDDKGNTLQGCNKADTAIAGLREARNRALDVAIAAFDAGGFAARLKANGGSDKLVAYLAAVRATLQGLRDAPPGSSPQALVDQAKATLATLKQTRTEIFHQVQVAAKDGVRVSAPEAHALTDIESGTRSVEHRAIQATVKLDLAQQKVSAVREAACRTGPVDVRAEVNNDHPADSVAHNNAVTDGYGDLLSPMDDCINGGLAGTDAVAPWLAFGQWASLNAGIGIKLTQDLIDIRTALLSPYGDKTAVLKRLHELMTDPKLAPTIAAMGGATTADLAAIASDVGAGDYGKAVAKASTFLENAKNTVDSLHAGLVKGNSMLGKEIQPLTAAFVNAVKAGKNPEDVKKAVLEAWGKIHGDQPIDPNLLHAFEKYGQAAELAKQIGANPANRAELVARKNALITDANFDMTAREQHVLQDKAIFGDPAVKAFFKATTGHMATDLPVGWKQTTTGNWANPPDRWGGQVVSPAEAQAGGPHHDPTARYVTIPCDDQHPMTNRDGSQIRPDQVVNGMVSIRIPNPPEPGTLADMMQNYAQNKPAAGGQPAVNNGDSIRTSPRGHEQQKLPQAADPAKAAFHATMASYHALFDDPKIPK